MPQFEKERAPALLPTEENRLEMQLSPDAVRQECEQ